MTIILDDARVASTEDHRGPDRRRAQQRLVARDRRRETRRLSDALDSDQLHLIQQPRIGLADGIETAIEAAPYWPRRDMRVAASLSAQPDDDVAIRVGGWLLQAAWALAACTRPGPVSIPVPTAALTAGTLARDVTAALKEAGLSGERLELRLPELALMERSTELMLCLSSLRDLGVRLAVDDFGARHGSLRTLRDLPLDTIRLDPGLTYDVSADGEDLCILRGIVEIAHARQMRLVACAVDGPERCAALAAIGLHEGVGPVRLWSRRTG